MTLLPSEADRIVRELTDGRMHVESDLHGVYLVHEETNDRVHLLTYQLTPDGLDEAVAELWEPQAM